MWGLAPKKCCGHWHRLCAIVGNMVMHEGSSTKEYAVVIGTILCAIVGNVEMHVGPSTKEMLWSLAPFVCHCWEHGNARGV